MNFKERWNRHWFKRKSPEYLAGARIIFFGFLFLYFAFDKTFMWAEIGQYFWEPKGWQKYIFSAPPSVSAVKTVEWIWKLSLLSACIGLYARLSSFISFFTGLYLVGLSQMVAYAYDDHSLILFSILVFTFSRCADSYSVDSWIRRNHGKKSSVTGPENYGWPLELVFTLFFLAFFAAGYVKLANSGLDWARAANFSSHLHQEMYFGLLNQVQVPTWTMSYFYEYPILGLLIAGFVLFFEVAALLGIFSRPLRLYIVLGLFLFQQIGQQFLFGWAFTSYLAVYLLFLWDFISPYTEKA